MIFSYNWLQSFFKKKLPKPEKLAELLTLHFAEVEEVKKSTVRTQEKKGDFVLDIDVRPNRAHDCLCHLGIAREISAILSRKLIILERRKLKLEKKKNILPIDLKVRCPSLVPRYSAIVIEGVKIGPSPTWLREKLEAIGVHSINNIVDLTNFVMFEIGQPLHAFDYDKIRGQRMILRQSKKEEKVITLDDFERTLDNGMLVIENEKKLIDLVGIMGGKLSEIDLKTKNIVLQAGNFDRRTIYQTTKKLDQWTLASNIYIQGIDPNLTFSTLERAYFLLEKLGGGKIVQIIDVYPKKVLPKKIKLNLDYQKNLLGIEISKKETINILKKLELKVTENSSPSISQIMVEVPTFRLDINLPEDLIEEVGRIYGYEKVKDSLPVAALIPPKRNLDIFWEDMTKDILKEAGFSEIYNYSFIFEKDKNIFGNHDLIEIENPISLDFQYLRSSLIPNLLKNIQKNQKNFQEIKIFELGKVFRKINKKLEEKRMLSGVISGKTPEYDKSTSGYGFYQLKGVIDILLNKLGISNIWYDSWKPTPEESKIPVWQLKKSAEIKINQEEIGFLGEISPRICEEMKVSKAVVFDIDFEKLSKLASEEHEYRPISPYPAAIRDIAILVPREVLVEEVLNKIETVGKFLIRDIDLFDIYEGEEIPAGKKNLAFHLIYQSDERTLTSKEIDDIQKRVIETLEKEEGWEVRK